MGKNKKGGFLNPMDKIRKDSRKRELKKNKQQRQLAKTTLMKIRDPYEIIGALERLDRVEFDPYNEPVLSEKVIETKRAKLMSSWGKLMAFHKKEDKERYVELKKIENAYNDRRDALLREYKAIRSTENVDLDEIPLPSAPAPSQSSSMYSNPFLNDNFKMPVNKIPPGCPQGLPPRLDELDIDDVPSSDDEGGEEKKNENNLTEFLKEIELISGEKDNKDEIDEEDNEKSEENNDSSDPIISSLPPIQSAPPILTVNPTPDLTTTTTNLPSSSSTSSVLPLSLNPIPNPPLLQPLPGQAPALRPMQGPRGSHPFRSNMPARHPFNHSLPYIPLPNSSQNQHHKNRDKFDKSSKQVETKTTTIEAKPQLRNLSQDATRFMPTALRNKAKQPNLMKKTFTQNINPIPEVPKLPSQTKAKESSKDAAYEEFMKEMQSFM